MVTTPRGERPVTRPDRDKNKKAAIQEMMGLLPGRTRDPTQRAKPPLPLAGWLAPGAGAELPAHLEDWKRELKRPKKKIQTHRP